MEVWSDFVCPFCYIGKRNFEEALEKFAHQKHVTVEYMSYELSPDAERHPNRTYYETLAQKLGLSEEEAKAATSQLQKQAEAVGLIYRFDTAQPTNTFDAHRLAKYASKRNKGNEMIERLLKAHFTDSEHIGERKTLIKLAGEIGLDKSEVTDMLASVDYGKMVRLDERDAKDMAIQGVPFFVFNEKYGVSGAQSAAGFTEVLEKVWEEETEKPIFRTINSQKSETTYCTDEGCEGSGENEH